MWYRLNSETYCLINKLLIAINMWCIIEQPLRSKYYDLWSVNPWYFVVKNQMFRKLDGTTAQRQLTFAEVGRVYGRVFSYESYKIGGTRVLGINWRAYLDKNANGIEDCKVYNNKGMRRHKLNRPVMTQSFVAKNPLYLIDNILFCFLQLL